MLRTGCSLVRLRCSLSHRLVSPSWRRCSASHVSSHVIVPRRAAPSTADRRKPSGHSFPQTSLHGGWRCHATKELDTVAPGAHPPGVRLEPILLAGFSAQQVFQFQEHLDEEGETSVQLVSLPRAAMGQLLEEVLQAWRTPAADSTSGEYGRIVLLTGPTAAAFATQINELLLFLGQPPAIIAAKQPRHDALAVGEVLGQLREAHLRYFDLRRPLQLLPGVEMPEEASVALNVTLDAGRVPTPDGGLREDVSHVVVLDGLCSEEERRELLAWLTAPDHDHSGPPPADKWELGCVDRSGDQPTWGLKAEVLQALQHAPPPPLLAIQSRLAALYPNYTLCHMPADAFEDPSPPDPSDPTDPPPDVLGAFVANAVMPGDACNWHVDSDPSILPGGSPWVQHFGWYVNREPGRPLFVTAMVYLNEEWAEESDAETMFMDPATRAGVFARPAPGRIVLMDQDMAHRISPPSRHAPGPRYSLVWKLVLFPEPAAAGATAPTPSIARPEWGEPQHFGSAAAGSGVPAFAMGRR